MPWWGWALFVLGMFWLAVFLGTIAEWRQGNDLFADIPVSTATGASDRPPSPPGRAFMVLFLALLMLFVPIVVVGVLPPYLLAGACVRLWEILRA